MSGKYRSYTHQKNIGISREERRRVHPVWRGVGFALMVLIPIISYASSEVLLNLNGKNNWMPIPVDLLMGRDDFMWRIFPDPMFYIKAIITIALIALLFAVFFWISFLFIGSMGITDRRDPYYVPPVQRRRRRRT